MYYNTFLNKLHIQNVGKTNTKTLRKDLALKLGKVNSSKQTNRVRKILDHDFYNLDHNFMTFFKVIFVIYRVRIEECSYLVMMLITLRIGIDTTPFFTLDNIQLVNTYKSVA